MQLNNLGSLITYDDDGSERCLGHLMEFQGRGVYEPNFGKVDVSPEDAKTHNRLLDEALIAGLDERCEVGYGGTFYLGTIDGRKAVTTFSGNCITTDVTVTGKSITFRRHGKVYRGRVQKEADCFNFRRIK